LCSALDDLGAMPSYGTSERQHVLEYTINVFVVYERLTSIATTDVGLLFELVDQAKSLRTQREAQIKATYGGGTW
jgi:hypothetical protein